MSTFASTPTSPQERAKRKAQAKSAPVLLIMVLCGVLSLIAGFIGALLQQHYSSVPASKVVLVNNSGETSTSQLAKAVQQQVGQTVVTFFPGSTHTFAPGTELGHGVVISTDGWLVTMQLIVHNQTSVTVVLPDGRAFLSQTIVLDPYSGVAFVKIQANQLPVVNFATAQAELGESIIQYTQTVDSGETITFGQIVNAHYSTAQDFSTTTNNLVYLTNTDVSSEYYGSPVFDDAGTMIGLNLSHHQVLPVQAFSNAIFPLFSKGSVTRSQLDLSYQAAYRRVNTNSAAKAGVVITAVKSNQTGLQAGDVITTVNGVTLDQDNDLAAVINDAAVNSTITFTVQRDHKTIAVPVKL